VWNSVLWSFKDDPLFEVRRRFVVRLHLFNILFTAQIQSTVILLRFDHHKVITDKLCRKCKRKSFFFAIEQLILIFDFTR